MEIPPMDDSTDQIGTNPPLGGPLSPRSIDRALPASLKRPQRPGCLRATPPVLDARQGQFGVPMPMDDLLVAFA